MSLPKHWQSVPLGTVATFAPKKPLHLKDSDEPCSFVPMASVEEESGVIQLDQTIGIREGLKRSLTYFNEGDVLFAKVTPCMENGKIAVAKNLLNGRGFGSSEFHVITAGASLDAGYLRYFLVSEDFRTNAAMAMTGAVGLRRVPRTYLQEHLIPLPPLDEQRRIVETLDDHLSRLDKALAETEYSSLGTKRFSTSLLHSMFTGDLMKRELGIQAINIVELADVAEVKSGGTPKGLERLTSETVSETHSVPFYKVGDMNRDARYMKSSRSYLTEGDVDSLRLKVIPSGSVVFPKAGGAIATDKKRLVQVAGPIDLNCMAVIPGAKMLPSYLAWFFESFKLSDLSNGSILPQISKTAVMQVQLPCPSLSDQEAVVQYLEENISRVRAQVQSIEGVASSIATLRRSILNDAFSGRLEDRDSSEQ